MMLQLEVLKKLVCDTVDSNQTELKHLSQQIWENPELKFEEFKAHDLLTTYFEGKGFTVQKKTPLETSFIARYGDSKGLKIGICCEYDALPDVGHACGHNLIAEVGVGAAVGLKAVIDRIPESSFEIIVYGTPAEEGGGGKIKMMEKGVFEEIDICMMSHPTPFEIPNPVWLGGAYLEVNFIGNPAHAAGAPWQGVNAVDAAVSCYTSLAMLRQQIKPEHRLHYIITDGGQALNVIPEKSSLQIGWRTRSNRDFDELRTKLENCIRGAAESTGCSFEIFDQMKTPYQAVKTNKVLIDLYVQNAKSVGVDLDNIDINAIAASTDFGNISQIKPSIHPLYKISTEGTNHTHQFNEASGKQENQLPTLNSAKSIAMTAVDVFCNSELLIKIKEEFTESN